MATKTQQPTEQKQDEIPTLDWPFAALAEAEEPLSDIIAENLGDDGLRPSDMSVARFPSTGGTAWLVGDERAGELIGVVLRQQVTRAFYATDFRPGGDEHPDCASADGVNGVRAEDAKPIAFNGAEAEYGGNCMRCPLNQWGSDLKGGRGKACREYRNLVFIRDADEFPMVVRIPPTAIGTWHAFCAWLTKKRVGLSRAVVQLALELDNGNTVLAPTLVGRLPAETSNTLRALVSTQAQAFIAAPESAPPVAELDEAPF